MNVRIVICGLLLASCANVAPRHATKRALLVGINDYASVRTASSAGDRDWPNLKGALNDVRAMQEILITRYGFEREDIITLTDADATREAILGALERHLVSPARSNDVLFFYFAGHGSQVPNSKSDEPDRLDESIVPADSRAGAHDIRDKELRRHFNRILDRGAHLTILLDHCHSASGARTPGVVARGIAPEDRDAADGADYGPRPERRGAIVLAAAEDFDRAWETQDERRRWHGAFSWAWLRSIREAAPAEPVHQTFARARARMAAEMPFQSPVLGGNAGKMSVPFLGIDPRNDSRTRIAVKRVQSDGTAHLQGGSIHGLSAGIELRSADEQDNPHRLVITSVEGPERSTARVPYEQRHLLHPGTLLEPTAAPSRAWLEHAPESRWAYNLGIRRARDGTWATHSTFGGERYDLVLRARTTPTEPRYVYVFAIDSSGRSTLLFPRDGSVENRFPIGAATPEIALGDAAAFTITEPYGRDTYILLTTDEAIGDPWVLQWDGVRAPSAQRLSQWSLERITVTSVPPPQTKPRRVF